MVSNVVSDTTNEDFEDLLKDVIPSEVTINGEGQTATLTYQNKEDAEKYEILLLIR